MVDTVEDRLDPVVVGLRKRVELVVVAAAAIDREPQEGSRDGSDQLGNLFLVSTLHFTLAGADILDFIPCTRDEKTRCGNAVATWLGLGVAGELFADEAGVGNVIVETVDDIVTVAPGMRAKFVVLVAVTFSEADHVQPVSSPALAVVR